MSRQRVTVLATRADLCPVCEGRGVVACHIPDPPGDWPWPRFVACPHCRYPWIGIQKFYRSAS